MSRLVPIALALVALSACSSDDAPSNGTGGGGGTTAAGTGGGGTAGTTGGTAGTTGGMANGGSAGSAGAPGGSAGMAATKDFPADTSADGITAFINAGDYKSATWASGMTAPTAPDPSSPHGLVQIWYNKALRTSHAAGHMGSSTDPTSMVVKELYTGTAVVGHIAMVRTTDPKWIYYCTSTEANRCYAGAAASTPIYQTTVTNCGCHGGGTVLTGAMIPAP
jgi:hypothetical protein